MEDRTEDIDILSIDESEENFYSQYSPSYHPGFEDITDDEVDNSVEYALSSYPLDQCSRTSPGNHSTMRRWKQRMANRNASIKSSHAKNTFMDHSYKEKNLNRKILDSFNTKVLSEGKYNSEYSQPDRTESHGQRSHSAIGFSPLCVETVHNADHHGPSSAPCPAPWGPQSQLSSASPVSTPCQTSTPLHHRKPKFPFHISSILGSPVVSPEKNMIERLSRQEACHITEEKYKNSLAYQVSTSIPFLPPSTPHYFYPLLQQQLLALHSQPVNSWLDGDPNLSNCPHTSTQAPLTPHNASAIEKNHSEEDAASSVTETVVSLTDSGLHTTTESFTGNTDASHLIDTNTEEENLIIDVEDCDDNSRVNASAANDILDTNSDNKEKISQLDISDLNQKVKPKLSRHNEDIANEKTYEEDTEHYYNPKKKIFAHWAKYGKDGSDISEAVSVNRNQDDKDINTENINQYRHKKIRRESNEILKADKMGKENCYVSKDSTDLIPENHTRKNMKSEKDCKKPKNLLPEKTKRKHHQKKKIKTKENFFETELNTIQTQSFAHYLPNQIRSCILTEVDLIDGLRILAKFGSHFYPGRLTEISPPDVYGIIIDKERGGKPHIFSREEILRDMILETRPVCVAELELGARVCVYWSTKINYLHPGTVAGPDTDQDYVIIQLDDGDSRDIHIDQVRYLPENFPLLDVTPEADARSDLYGSRKKCVGSKQSNSSDCEKQLKGKGCKTKRSLKSKRDHQKHKFKKDDWTVVVTEVIDNVETANNISVNIAVREEDQDSAFESDEDRDDSNADKEEGPKSSIAAFLPAQQLLWAWADEGRKLSPKSRKVYHHTIERDGDRIHVGDCVVFLSTGRPDRPYIGQIDSMWQNSSGNMRVQVMWFYHPAEVEGTAVGGGRVEDIKKNGALFSSLHSDENDVQTISHSCLVLPLAQFTTLTKDTRQEDREDTYYLAGQYDPVEGTIAFTQGLWE
jgi:hypothetical protein